MTSVLRSVASLVVLIELTAGCQDRSGDPAIPDRVDLTPAAASVTGGDTLAFTAVGRTGDAAEVQVAVSFSATGGTITMAGVYSAGDVPGIYRVTAVVEGLGLADTSVVTVTRPGARVYTTGFPQAETPISEGGAWTGGGAMGLDWTDVSTHDGVAIGNQVGASYTDATAILEGPWAPDQMASATVHAAGAPGDACYPEVELRLRSAISPHSNTGYEVGFKVSRTSAAYLIVVRWNGALGDFTYLTKLNGARFGVGDGDVVSARMVGPVIVAYKNGVPVGHAVDTIYTEGSPGMGFNLENGRPRCRGTNDTYGFTSFTAAELR